MHHGDPPVHDNRTSDDRSTAYVDTASPIHTGGTDGGV
jgi:hypothetical protein